MRRDQCGRRKASIESRVGTRPPPAIGRAPRARRRAGPRVRRARGWGPTATLLPRSDLPVAPSRTRKHHSPCEAVHARENGLNGARKALARCAAAACSARRTTKVRRPLRHATARCIGSRSPHARNQASHTYLLPRPKPSQPCPRPGSGATELERSDASLTPAPKLMAMLRLRRHALARWTTTPGRSRPVSTLSTFLHTR